jgi:hypothetical protein
MYSRNGGILGLSDERKKEPPPDVPDPVLAFQAALEQISGDIDSKRPAVILGPTFLLYCGWLLVARENEECTSSVICWHPIFAITVRDECDKCNIARYV